MGEKLAAENIFSKLHVSGIFWLFCPVHRFYDSLIKPIIRRRRFRREFFRNVPLDWVQTEARLIMLANFFENPS